MYLQFIVVTIQYKTLKRVNAKINLFSGWVFSKGENLVRAEFLFRSILSSEKCLKDLKKKFSDSNLQSVFAYRVNMVLTSHFGQGSAPRFINSFLPFGIMHGYRKTHHVCVFVSGTPKHENKFCPDTKIYRFLYSILGIGQEVRGYERGAAGLKGNEGRVG